MGTDIRGFGLLELALKLQQVTQLQVGIGVPRLKRYCRPISVFRFRQITGLFENVTILDKNR